MVYTIILIILSICSLSILGWLIWRKWPQLRIVDPSSSKESKTKRLKYDLMRKRVERTGGKHIKTINKSVVQPLGSGIQNVFRRFAGKLTAVERAYKERQKKAGNISVDSDTIKKLLDEGEKLMQDESWDRAEKKFIEVISGDSKNVMAYESLGRLYLQKKDFELASETFQFLTKLSPEDPSVIASLGEVEERLGRHKKAFEHFKKAHKLSPNNPKYLDFFIEAAIQIDDKLQALDALDHLKKVNPANKKIPLFEKHISEIDMVSAKEGK